MKRKKFSSKTEEANQIIIGSLLDGPKPFGQIKKHLQENRIKYSKKGLILRLHQLEKDRKIGKKMVSNHIHPVYYIIDKELKDQYIVADGGNSFQMDSMRYFYENPKNEKNSKKMTDSMIKQLATRIGLYVIYCHLHSWKLTSNKQTLNHNLDLKEKWLFATLRWPIEHNRYIDYLFDFIDPETYNSPKILYQDEKQIKKLFQLEHTLAKLFPKEISFLDSNLSKIPEKSRISRILTI